MTSSSQYQRSRVRFLRNRSYLFDFNCQWWSVRERGWLRIWVFWFADFIFYGLPAEPWSWGHRVRRIMFYVWWIYLCVVRWWACLARCWVWTSFLWVQRRPALSWRCCFRFSFCFSSLLINNYKLSAWLLIFNKIYFQKSTHWSITTSHLIRLWSIQAALERAR